MSEAGRKVRELRQRRGWTLRKLGDEIGKTAAYLSMIENGERAARIPVLARIAEVLGVELSFFTGEVDGVEKKSILKEMQELVDRHSVGGEARSGAHRVPVLSDISAGPPFSRTDQFPVGFAEEYIEIPDEVRDPHAFGLRIKGDSMEPRLFEGDVVIVCPSWKVRADRPVVAKVRDDEIACKVYSRIDGMVVLTSLNPKYPPQIYKESDVIWIYPVARAISNTYG